MQLESRNLAPGTINVRLAAVRRLAYEAADAGLLSPELAAGIRRVKGAKNLGIRLGNWLSASEARALWRSPDAETLKGKRDRAIIAVLRGCGLRRRELADLTFDHLQRREDHWAIVDLIGKGGHVRTVPVPDWVKQFLDKWFAAARVSNGKLFRCVCHITNNRHAPLVGLERLVKRSGRAFHSANTKLVSRQRSFPMYSSSQTKRFRSLAPKEF